MNYDSTLIRNQMSLETTLFQDKHCDYHHQPSPGQVQVPTDNNGYERSQKVKGRAKE